MGKKATRPADAEKFEHIPNVGPRIAEDFQRLGLKGPAALKKEDPYKLYQRLCRKDGVRHDPCVLDTFMAAVDFMKTGTRKNWWAYTAARKKRYAEI